MGTPTPPAGPQLPDEVVVRPDHRRYRRYFTVRWVVVILTVTALLVAGLAGDDVASPGWAVAGGLIFGVVAVVSLIWRWRTYLDPEPALVLRADQFRIRHKRQDLWVPWTDVASVRRYTKFARGHMLEFLEFVLVPEAEWKLPMQDAPFIDQLMMWHPDDLVYSRPCDTPGIEELEWIAQHLHAQATAGHRPGGVGRARPPEHR